MRRIERLLLIDDDPGVLRALGLLLETMKFTVVPFSSPSQALAYVTSGNDVDVVVTDLRMPELSGDAVLRELRVINQALPVIVMSGHITANEATALKQQGAAGVIPKPFSPGQLLELIGAIPLSGQPSL
ncbi:MAG: response regulator [Pseudomonadota bacterium]|jgi:DNA-binding NtrC family response regulator